MPWQTPTLYQVRSLVRDMVHGSLPGSDATIPNSVLRVMSDVQGAMCFLTLEYLDWLALQIMPDTAETIWLDRWANMYLVNADGTVGRKLAVPSSGTVAATGTQWSIIPSGTILQSGILDATLTFQTTQMVYIGNGPTSVPVIALQAGAQTNLLPGAQMSFVNVLYGVDSLVTVIGLTGGADVETDDELRTRLLKRMREPPMGGDATDWEQWTLAVSGVTRAWAFPQEMGIGTMTVRFMMDELRAANGGFPLPSDIDAVTAYLNTVRPVTVKDFFVESPIPYPINVEITSLDVDQRSTHVAIVTSLNNEFFIRSAPGQTWFRAWTDEGIMAAVGVNSYDLMDASDAVMPGAGYMPVLGDVTYG